MEEDDDDSGSVVQGKWVRKHGYVTECDIDARWILYYPNDDRPQGSLRIVSHPDLPPGHLRSFVSIVTKRHPKSPLELSRTLQNYGLLDNDLFFYNDVFYKSKVAITYYLYNNIIYQNKKIRKEGNKLIVSYHDPIAESEIMKGKVVERTKPLWIEKERKFSDEFSVVTYSEPITNDELRHMLRTVSTELESYNVQEHVETWDTETMDKMKNLEQLYNVKIFG